MANSQKTLMTPGHMKRLGIISSNAIPTKMSARLAQKLDSNNYLSKKLKKFWDEILKEDGIETFIVGEAFQHRNTDCVLQHFGDNFNNWLWVPEKHIEIIIDTEAIRKLNEYRLSNQMKDFSISKDTGSKPISLNEYWLIRYLLIIDPELGKKLGYELKKDGTKYLFHVQKPNGLMFFTVLSFWGDMWDSDAFRYGESTWMAGTIFLFRS